MTGGARKISAPGMAIRTAAILFVFVIAFTGLLSAAYQWTKPAIEASAAEEKMKLVDDVLPRAEYDNALLNDTLTLPPTPQLGLDEPSTLYRARMGGKPVALVFEAVAPDGYAGKVRLLIALRADGTLAGVRVTQHKETPGLGDYVDPKKDKNKSRPWITQFTGMSLATVANSGWKVKKDGGNIDYYAGATVTPRAVSKAVLKAVQWAEANRTRLIAETGATK
ncbi:MAG: electron transport complex subunit RsxG [Dechloromonas sp.]|uniref:Ion-translocating oxidoreductase complex subunit G n=1 Tax=Candidatus Dechloromonas phosphorivorans TaxID=2899244 RepID=A0A9D7QNM5_9RHOO|nr:electron transport complex subunit RsxG [Candidatus Dechloromonas phosphorivorans]